MSDTTTAAMESGDPMAWERPLRCACNKLLCVIKGDDIEIRCNKCKRYTLIRTRGIVGMERGEDPFAIT